MMMRQFNSSRGFTLVELMVSMSLGMIVMLAVFSTYAYLGRNLTRLSYRSVMESQSRKILATLAADIRNTKSIANPPSANPSSTSLTLNMTSGGTVVYDYSANKLTRNPNGTGAIALIYDIGDANVQVPVSMLNFSFLYSTTSGGDPASQFAAPASPITPMSIKQVAINFTLQAGTDAIQGQQGTQSIYQVASSWMPLVNRQLPDGS